MPITHIGKLVISPKTVDRGGTCLNITGTTQVTGAITTTSGAVTTLTSNSVTATGVRIASTLAISSAANGAAGIKNVATAGTGIQACTAAKTSSRILLTPIGITNRGLSAWVSTIGSGTNFTIKLTRTQTTGTIVGATGRVAYMVINK